MYKFIADRMVCKLGRWLRIFGYDTKMIKEENDERYGREDDGLMLKIAEEEGRILVTRDVALFREAIKYGQEAVCIKANSLEEQIIELKKSLDIDIDLKMNRCTICNGNIVLEENIDELYEKDYVPKKLISKEEKFWKCAKCGQIYWIGSHWENMKEKIKKIEEMEKNSGLMFKDL
ncbi:MAG: hypothetical protein MASP_00543 [Candidatus Methanolliviera sp. GoM_asphalt]|nr:MAG: hypothetical protein MASP_00543 [Candidatus Methanolliviera sp. GoM_asphalt]